MGQSHQIGALTYEIDKIGPSRILLGAERDRRLAVIVDVNSARRVCGKAFCPSRTAESTHCPQSPVRPAAIDHENLAADHLTVVGSEEQRHPRDIGRVQEAPHRLLLPDEFELLFGPHPMVELLVGHDPARR